MLHTFLTYMQSLWCTLLRKYLVRCFALSFGQVSMDVAGLLPFFWKVGMHRQGVLTHIVRGRVAASIIEMQG
jgi:hypothetical protein